MGNHKRDPLLVTADDALIRQTSQTFDDEPKCLDRMMTLAGWLFDMLTVCINLSDVTTDVLVAIQFATDKEWTWFWLVVSSLILANCVYTFVTVEILREEMPMLEFMEHWPRPVAYPVIFLIAQLMPFLNWASSTYHSRCASSSSKAKRAQKQEARVRNRAAREELGNIAKSNRISDRMQAAFEEHFKAHCMFYVESAVEAAPQAVIQLLAISYMGNATPVQVISLCLSLFSITAKAFMISNSYDVRVFLFKYLLAVFDVFAVFYIFASIVARDGPKDVHLWGEVWVSYMGLIWLCKLGFYLLYAAVVFLFVALYLLCIEGLDKKEICIGIGMGLAGIIMAIPVLVVFEAVKLSYALLGITGVQPDPKTFKAFALLQNFVDNDPSDDHERLRFIFGRLCHHFEEKDRLGRLTPPRRPRAKGAPVAPPPRPSAEVAKPLGDLHTQRVRVILSKKGKLNPWDLYTKVYVEATPWFELRRKLNSSRDAPGGYFTIVTCLVITVGQLYSFVFPFINAALYYSSHNLLQKVTLIAASSALFLALVLSPFAYRYVRFCMTGRYLQHYGKVAIVRDKCTDWVAEYYAPSHVGVLQSIIAPQVVPHDVLEMVGGFITAKDVCMDDLSRDECLRLQKEVRERRAMIEAEAYRSDHDDYTNGPTVAASNGGGQEPAPEGTTREESRAMLRANTTNSDDDDGAGLTRQESLRRAASDYMDTPLPTEDVLQPQPAAYDDGDDY